MTGLAVPNRATMTSALDAAINRLEKVVDHEAIRHNLGVLRDSAAGRKVMPVVKGDAYGLGAVPIARTLVQAGADALAVDTVAEGIALRAAGIGHPVLVMDIDVAENAAACLDAGLTPAIARPEQADRYARLARERGERVSVWLRTNIGFNRFGPRDGFDALLGALYEHQGPLRFAGLFAHLTSSTWEEAETGAQAAEFATRLAAIRSRFGGDVEGGDVEGGDVEGGDVEGGDVEGSLAATHGLVHPATLRGTTWIRPGIGVYGTVVPTARRLNGWRDSGLDRLRPVWQVRARVLDIVTVTGAEGLGYDRAVQVTRGQRIASVAIGFSRGITARAAGFSGLLHGTRCHWIGRPGMDCSQVDVTAVPRARAGDWLTVIGTSGALSRGAEDVSDELGHSLYELMAVLHMPVRHVGAAPEKDIEID